MKKDFLFPSGFAFPGWIMCAVFGAASILWMFDIIDNIDKWFGGYIDEVITVGLIVGLTLVAFSKEKDEDEYTMQIRAKSLVWAVIADNVLIICATLFVYGLGYLYVMSCQLFMLLVLYIIKFRITIYKVHKSVASYEE